MRLVRLLPCVLPLSLVGCGCGSWSVTVPGGASYQGTEPCGWDNGAELEYRPTDDHDYVVDVGTWGSDESIAALLNKLVLAPADLDAPGEIPFVATLTYSDGEGAYTADLVEGAVTVVRPREEVEDVLLYDHLTLAWDLVFDGADGLSGSFRGQDELRVVRP